MMFNEIAMSIGPHPEEDEVLIPKSELEELERKGLHPAVKKHIDKLRTENAELKRERDQACEAIRDIGVIADANLTFAGDWRTYLFAAIQAYVNKIQEQGERIAELEAALEKALSCGQPCAGWDNKRGWKEAKAALEEE
jgi:hypothetical protein